MPNSAEWLNRWVIGYPMDLDVGSVHQNLAK